MSKSNRYREEKLDQKPCRDCGYLLVANARGCPRCAMNVEAERMIERIFWRLIVPSMLLLAVLATVGMMWWWRQG